MPSYTVSLELPDIDADDPVAAVRDFQNFSAGSGDLYVYRVTDEKTGVTQFVDMASGPSVTIVKEGMR